MPATLLSSLVAPLASCPGRHLRASSRRAVFASAATGPSRRALLMSTVGGPAAGAVAAAAAAAPGPEQQQPQQPLQQPQQPQVDVKMEDAPALEGQPQDGAGSAQKPSAPIVTGDVPRAELAPGFEISRIVKGCWQLSGGHGGERSSDRTSGQAAVDDFQPFVVAGITTFDTADIYGPSESLIGRYLASHASEKPLVQVLTKFCCFGDSMGKARELRFVEQSIDGSRQRLGLETLDLVQFYWHNYGDKGYVQAAKNLAELQKKGKIRHVGATNFDVPRLREMLDAGVTIVNNQVQYSLLDRRPENGMAQFCAQHGITLLPYGAVAGGFLSDKYLGKRAQDVRVDTYSKSKYASVIREAGGWDWFQELLRALQGVAQRHQVSISDVAVRWVLDKPQVAGVIVGARNTAHVGDLERVFKFQLDEADRAAIDKVLAAGTQSTGDCYDWERGGKW